MVVPSMTKLVVTQRDIMHVVSHTRCQIYYQLTTKEMSPQLILLVSQVIPFSPLGGIREAKSDWVMIFCHMLMAVL